MTTPEQQAREMLEKATSSDLPVLVADIISERDALKAELAAIKAGAGEPYCYVYEWLVSPGVWHRSLSPDKYNGRDCDSFIGLYTRPCVPLTNEQVWSIAGPHITHYQFGEATHRDINCLAFARAIEAAHNIKGAEG